MNLLSLQNITKHYAPNEPAAVNNISFNCYSGEVVALIGSSGSGKTTLLRIIAGLEIPDSGKVILNEKTLNSPSVFIAPEKRDCGLVFQDYALFPNKTVRQNITFGKGAMDDPASIDKLMDITNIAGLEQRFPHEISGGQQQRVALVRALATRPSLLLLDEPLSHLDPELKQSVRIELLRLFDKTETTVVFVSHDIEDAIAMADRVVVMHNGQAEQIGTPDEIYRQPVNSNIALLFGKTDFIPIELIPNAKYSFKDKNNNKQIVPVRPQQWSIINDSATDLPTFDGIIKSVKNRGSNQEIEFKTGKLTLTLQLPRNIQFQAGDALTIAYNPDL